MTDHTAIQDVITSYCDSISRRDWQQLGSLFAPEAAWEVIGGPAFRFAGDGIAPGIRGIVESTGFIVQINAPALITIEGERATARTTLYEFGETLDKKTRFEEPGIYDDVLARSNGRWLFVSRRFTILQFRSARWTAAEEGAMDRRLTELLDKQAITEGLYRYCRSMDRMDKDLFRRTFHPDMTAQYLPGQMIRSAEEFMDWMWGYHRGYHNHSHQVSNILIEVSGDEAGSESYVHARLTRRLPDGRFELTTVMGRYVDRWQKRNGEWKIANRRYLHDIMDVREIEDRIPPDTTFAVRDPDDIRRDPSYEAIDRGCADQAAS
jgi:hypothetical protein